MQLFYCLDWPETSQEINTLNFRVSLLISKSKFPEMESGFPKLLILLFLFSFRVWGQEKMALDTLPTRELGEQVVTASRQEETLLKSPVSVEKLNLQNIRRSAQPGFFEAIQNMKGIQVITPSLGFRVINARGFAYTTNVRFVQLVDGVDNQAPHSRSIFASRQVFYGNLPWLRDG